MSSIVDWKPAFLESLARLGNIKLAAEAAGITRQNAYAARKADPDFAEKWDDAIEQAVDDLQEAARKRAMEGSDALLIFLLKAHRPSVYRDNFKIDASNVTEIRIVEVDHDPNYLTGGQRSIEGGQNDPY